MEANAARMWARLAPAWLRRHHRRCSAHNGGCRVGQKPPDEWGDAYGDDEEPPRQWEAETPVVAEAVAAVVHDNVWTTCA